MYIYRQTSNISRTLVGNKLVGHSNCIKVINIFIPYKCVTYIKGLTVLTNTARIDGQTDMIGIYAKVHM